MSLWATVLKDGFTVPLIGIGPSAVLEKCDVCGDEFPLRNVEIGKEILCNKCKRETMRYNVQTTNQGRYALVASDGRTIHLFHSEHAAQTACDAMNHAAYEPAFDPYAPACGRWDRKPGKRKAHV